jgi:uncharacterized membrane protein YuzA (DUF378 family)
MARAQASPASPAKEPGRIKQMWQVFQMTRRYDKSSVWWLALGFFGPIIAAVLLSIFAGGGPLAIILYIITGILAGMLLFLIILGRKAEKAAYSQLKGQPGAVGVVLRSSLKRGWRGSEMPVAVNGKTQDAVYRAVGRGGVVLIGEGPKSRTKRMLEDERRKVQRVLPNVPVGFVTVGPDPDSVELHKLAGSLRRFKKTLTKTEILAVSNRLDSLGQSAMPIPKGVDPFKVRAQRPR